MFKEFKKFVMRGNVMDLAIGVIIGAAFKDIVTSLVNDILMPVIGIFLGKVDFSSLKIVIEEAVGETPELAIYYGNFIQNVVNFLIIAFVIFLMVRAINRLSEKKEEEVPPAPPEPTEEVLLLREIRDNLKKSE
jgi:large conductance mechanosensitive channel